MAPRPGVGLSRPGVPRWAFWPVRVGPACPGRPPGRGLAGRPGSEDGEAVDVRVITADGVTRHSSDELETLLDGPGLVWIDVKYWDADTAARARQAPAPARPCRARVRGAQPRGQGAHLPRPGLRRAARPRARAWRARALRRARPGGGAQLAAHRARPDERGRRARRRLRRDLDGRPAARQGLAAPDPGLRAVGRAGQRARRPDAQLPRRADPAGVGAGAAGHGRARGRHGAVPRGAVRGPARPARRGDHGRDEPRGVRADERTGRSSERPARPGSPTSKTSSAGSPPWPTGSAATCRA